MVTTRSGRSYSAPPLPSFPPSGAYGIPQQVNDYVNRYPYVGAALGGLGALGSAGYTYFTGQRGGAAPMRRRKPRRQPAPAKAGKFRKRKKVRKANPSLRLGSSKVIETGGEISSSAGGLDRKVLYIGHSTFNRDQVLASVCRAIVRKLYSLADFDCSSFEDLLPAGNGGHQINLEAYDGVNDISINTYNGIAFNNTQTYFAIAEDLADTITSIAANPNRSIEIQTIRLIAEDQGGLQRRPLASMTAKDIMLHLHFTSKLTVQNRTLATNDAVSDPNRDEANNVEHNPLRGRRYMWTGNAPVQRSLTTTRQTVQLAPQGNSGFMSYIPEDAEDLARWHKPPLPQFFRNCKKSSRISISPGEIKSSYLLYKKSISLFTFFRLFDDNLRQMNIPSTAAVRTSMGNSEVIGVEKLLDSRQNEPVIALGYELTQSFASYITYKKRQAAVQIFTVT